MITIISNKKQWILATYFYVIEVEFWTKDGRLGVKTFLVPATTLKEAVEEIETLCWNWQKDEEKEIIAFDIIEAKKTIYMDNFDYFVIETPNQYTKTK